MTSVKLARSWATMSVNRAASEGFRRASDQTITVSLPRPSCASWAFSMSMMSASTAPTGRPGCWVATAAIISVTPRMFSSAMAAIMSSLLAK